MFHSDDHMPQVCTVMHIWKVAAGCTRVIDQHSKKVRITQSQQCIKSGCQQYCYILLQKKYYNIQFVNLIQVFQNIWLHCRVFSVHETLGVISKRCVCTLLITTTAIYRRDRIIFAFICNTCSTSACPVVFHAADWLQPSGKEWC